jgi:hypothetical protein
MFGSARDLRPITDDAIAIAAVQAINFLQPVQVRQFRPIAYLNEIFSFNVRYFAQRETGSMINLHPNVHNNQGNNNR